MFCRKCGKEIPDDSEFCPKCGMSVGKEISEQVNTQEDTVVADTANSTPNETTVANEISSNTMNAAQSAIIEDKPCSHKKKSIIPFVVIAIVVVVFAAIFIPVKINIDAKNKEAHHEFEYHLSEDGTYIIDGYHGDDPNVVIPATINKILVTQIGEKAFYGTDIQSVIVGEHIFEIGQSAFADCNQLKSVQFLFNKNRLLVYIDSFAFCSCFSLSEVKFSDNSMVIRNNAFDSCTSLKKIDLLNVTVIGEYAFSASGLQSVELHTPKIEANAFAHCENLKDVSLGNLSDIPVSIFEDCISLETVTWNFSAYSDNKIGNKAFYGCTSLKQFDIGGLYTITYPKGFNEYISELKEPDAKDVVIGTEAFAGCENFKDPELVMFTFSAEDLIGKSVYNISSLFGTECNNLGNGVYECPGYVRFETYQHSASFITVTGNNMWLTSNGHCTDKIHLDMSYDEILNILNEEHLSVYGDRNEIEVYIEYYNDGYDVTTYGIVLRIKFDKGISTECRLYHCSTSP